MKKTHFTLHIPARDQKKTVLQPNPFTSQTDSVFEFQKQHHPHKLVDVPGQFSVSYITEEITQNTIIAPDGFACIKLDNRGDDGAVILGAVPLNPSDLSYELINRPGELISTQIPIVFAGDSANKKIIVLKTYYLQKQV